MSFVLSHVSDALRLAFAMFWQVLWPLALGFLLSAVVETLESLVLTLVGSVEAVVGSVVRAFEALVLALVSPV